MVTVGLGLSALELGLETELESEMEPEMEPERKLVKSELEPERWSALALGLAAEPPHLRQHKNCPPRTLARHADGRCANAFKACYGSVS